MTRHIAQLRWIAYHDAYTDLPNRRALLEKMYEVAEKTSPHLLTLSVISLENSTELKSTFGVTAIEEAIKQLVKRFESINDAKFISHTETTQIALLIGSDGTASDKIQDALVNLSQESISYKGIPLHVDTKVVNVRMSKVSQSPEDYLRQAEVALATARIRGEDSATYQAEFVGVTEENLAILGELRTAVKQDQLSLHYQPKIDLTTGAVQGVEALLRWHHPRRGNIPPSVFIPRAEESTLIHCITDFALGQAMKELNIWRQQGLSLSAAVNVSTRNLISHGFADSVVRLLDQHGLSGEVLELEVTEGALMTDVDHAASELQKLARLNIAIYIDDFGTGYSSLQYLHRLPVSHIKVDQSFIRRLHDDYQAVRVVEAAVGLAHSLGLKVVAEGVETIEVYDLLRNIGCDMAQGFLISRPLPAEAFVDWLKQYKGQYHV